MKKFLKCCSIFLTLVLLFHMVPLQAFALGTEQPGSPKETEPARIVEEVVSERTEYTKTYRMDNGTFTAAVYNTPVHYLSEETWQEIDNTLRTMNDGTYANTAGVWDVRFPQELSDEKAVTITKDGNTLSFYMAGKLTAQESPGSVSASEQPLTEEATVTINGSTETFAVSSSQTADAQIQQLEDPEAEGVDSRMVLEKSASRLTYENVYSNTHVQYDLQGNQVKESVILESYQSDLRGYRYVLETGSMVPVLNSDGSIDFLDEEEALVMRMPAPFLVDQNGEVSSDVQVALAGKGGMYVLVYLLPEQWLSSQERAWPVVLDPVVIADPDALSNIKDRGVASGATYAIDRVYLECGHSTTTGINRFYIKFSNLPELSSSDVILGADLRLRRISSTGDGGIPVEAHKVLGTWESATINWSNKPAFDETIEDYQIVDANGYYHWDITDVVRGWYSGENTGVMFKTDEASENATIKNYRQFYSSDTGIPDRMPTLIVYYRNNNGLEGYWDYTSASAGRAGTGYVNSYTGNMVWIRGDMGFGGNRMPVSISHVYNLNDADNNEFSMGNGWRTNLNQKVYRWSANTNYYIWEDADGTDHYFLYNTQTQRIEDEDGLGLVLNTGTDEWKYSITDKNGNVSYFDSYGRLTSIVNNRTPADPAEAASDGTEEEQPIPSSISIGYSGSTCKITTVTDGAGRIYEFAYDNGLLRSITYKGSNNTVLYTVSYTYTGNNLTAITDTGVDVDPGEIVDAESQTTTYTYLTGTSILESAQDIDGYKLVYSYYTPTADYQPYRVHQIREYSGTEAGGVLTIEYAHNQTTFTDRNGNIQILQFNDFGNTVSVQDGEGRAQYAQYLTNSHTETGKANQLNLSSKLQNTVGNRLPDSSFEGSSTSWHPAGNASAAYTPSTAESYLGSQSLALAGSVTATTESAAIAAGETVTFSAYVKGSGVKLQLGTASSETTGSNAAWTRLQVSYTNNTAASVSLAPKIVSSGTGTVYIDCVQLEKAPTASRYNLIQNGDFRNDAAWSNTAGICIYQTEDGQEDIAAPQLEHRVYSLSGIMTEANRVSQTVNVSGAAGDTFVISGWAKGDSVPTPEAEEGQNQRRFAVAATFHYTNGETKTFYANFNPDTDSSVRWQYAAQVMVAEEAYSSVTVELCYDYNANTVYFDGIGLYKETFGSSYTYDEDGNVTSVVDLQKQTTTYEYQDNNLTKATLPTGAELTYTYDDYHNVTRATSATGVVYEFGYDAYGNNTTVSIVGADGKKITSSAAYSDDGNTLVSTTDAAGMVTRYHYNADTNVLEWVQYPNDSDTSRTEYTYDSMYRAASAAAEISDTVTQSVVYTYENDLLKTLTTPSTTYSFSYGAFSLRSKISIGTRNLAEYTYTDKDYYLQSLEYGNGDKVQYTYDTLGRVTCQTYEDGDTVTYRYDNDGALATVTDSATGRTTTYYYDFIDRLVKYVETGEDYYHSVGYGYDTINNLTAVNETINGITFTTSYAYDNDNRVTSVTSGGTERTYTYDAYSRITQRITKQGEAEILKQNLIYKDGPDTDPDTDLTTGQVYRLTNDAAGYDKTYEYTYDGNGNIQTVFDGTYTTRYVYDKANQLIRENNQELGKTWTWTYDAAGNIVNRKEYAYSTADDDELGTPTDTVLYGYTDATWGDLLTSYDGTGIIYDDVGNPLTDGTWTYTWEHGRQLAGLYGEDVNGGLNDVTVTYTYNADGMRIGKTVVTRTYEENHTHVYSAQIVPPTCTQQGYTLHTCACGASYKDTYVAALGHMVSNGRCIRCGYVGGITPPITPPGGGEIMSVTAGDTAVVLSTGTRVLKSTQTITYKYVYNGGSLSQMVVTTTTNDGDPTTYVLNFQYDASGTPMSVVINGSEKLYYVTNLQGDVVALLNESGNEVAEYTYSAYGEVSSQFYVNSTNSLVGAMFNPLQYRGYVHDIETDWYYLQSRYYDPEVGRFINADALVSTGQGFEGNNMFVYCGNNPVNYLDKDGYFHRSYYAFIDYLFFEGSGGISGVASYNLSLSGVEVSSEFSTFDSPGLESNDYTYSQAMHGQVAAGFGNMHDLEIAYASFEMSGLVLGNKTGNLDVEWMKLGNIEAGAALKTSGFEAEAHISAYSITATYDLYGADISASFHAGAIGFGTEVDSNCIKLTFSFVFGFTICIER